MLTLRVTPAMEAGVTDRVGSAEENCGTLGLRDFMKYIGVGISLGLCFGAALGAAMQNVAVGVAVGVALGSAFGIVFSGSSAELDRKKVAADKPPSHPLGL